MSTPALSATASRPRTGARLLSPTVALTAIVVAATGARLGLSLGRTMPRYLPDEFLYPELARSIGAGHGPAVLGLPAFLPSLLEPLVLAPLWTVLSPSSAIVATQALHALLVALAALPTYAIGRSIGLTARASLLCAAAAAFAPGAFFAALLTADALGYLLALVAIAVALRSLTTPTWATQALTLGAIGLAASARIQYAILLPAYAVGAVAVERSARTALRRHPLPLGALVAALVLAPVAGSAALGRYEAATSFGASTAVLRWTGAGALLLVAATGLALAPGAVAWAGATIVRPSGRPQAALAGVAAALVAALLAVSSVMTVDTSSDRFLERYLVVAAPLVALAFAAWLAEGRPGRPVAVVLGLVVVVAAMRIPLSGYTGGQGTADSPTLLALARLESALGVGDASLVASGILAVAGLLSVALGLRLRVAPVAVGVAAAMLALVAVGSHSRDGALSRSIDGVFADDPSWIDAAGAGDALLVQTAGSTRFDAMLTALLNPSVRRAAPLGTRRIDPFDGLATAPLRIGPDGRLLEQGRPVSRPVVWALGGTAAAFDDAQSAVYDRRFALVVPRGDVRLAMVADGLRYDGKVSQSGTLTVYPTASGRCTRLDLELLVPADVPPTTLEVRTADGVRRLVVAADAPARLSLVSGPGAPRTLAYRTLLLGDRTPTPYDATVADARYRTTTVACGAHGTPS